MILVVKMVTTDALTSSTSGATESNNLAIKGAAEFLKAQGDVQGVPALTSYQAALGNEWVAKASGQ